MTDRDKKGCFKAGNRRSKGRPKGALNRTTRAAMELLEGEAEAITRKAIDLTKAGDVIALGLVLRYLFPKTRSVQSELPPLASAADVPAAIGAIIEAVAIGELTPDEAASVASLVDYFGASADAAELEAKIAELESELASERA